MPHTLQMIIKYMCMCMCTFTFLSAQHLFEKFLFSISCCIYLQFLSGILPFCCFWLIRGTPKKFHLKKNILIVFRHKFYVSITLMKIKQELNNLHIWNWCYGGTNKDNRKSDGVRLTLITKTHLYMQCNPLWSRRCTQ